MVATHHRTILGKIAAGVGAALDARARSGAPAGIHGTSLASGGGWKAVDNFFLGNAGECYECSHDHAPGDRCVSFHFTPTFIDDLAAELGVHRARFGASRVPPGRGSSGLVATIATALAVGGELSWEEVAIDAAATALVASQADRRTPAPLATPRRSALERVTHVVRAIERDPAAERDLRTLAADAKLSAFQFLRAFRRLTGITPHQYLLRARLRESAASLRASDRRIVEIALEYGFNDLSNFNHAFRGEFGASPRA
jgi:AraC-like DNA-binding protein